MKMDAMMEEEEPAWNYKLDISQLCRICANPNDYLIPIFQGEGLEHELKNKISKHLPIKVSENDKLPINLCYQCASTLIAWHDMVVGCIEADVRLKALIQDDTNETDSVEQKTTEESLPLLPPKDGIKTEKTSIGEQITKLTEPEDMVQQTAKNSANKIETEMVVQDGTALEPESLEEEVPSDPRDELYFKTEEISEVDSVPMGEDVPEVNSVPIGEDAMTAVEVYEDVETSVIVHDFVEGIEDGQYIAYIGDDYVESSVEIINQEMEEVAESEDESKPYICEDCGKVFKSFSLFKTHSFTHQNRHFCNNCDATYKRIDHLQKHMTIMHPNSSCEYLPKEKKVNPYAKTFLCNTCGKILKSSMAYENHTLKHQSKCPFPCSICSETFPNRGARRKHEVKEHNIFTKENGNPDGYHVCEICGLEMFSDGAYYHHKDKHGDPYPCTFCGKLYGSRSLMQVHARRHTNERPFVCGVCNRNFKVKQELNAHMNIHKDLRPYQCPHCPKMCRKSSDLTHHIRTHTGEKPYICDKCGRGFAQAGDMRKHRQLHFRPSKINKNIP